MARRSKLTQDVQNKIISAIKSGATYEMSAQYAGIAPSTLYLWMKQGRDGKARNKIEFLENIKRAESTGAIANLSLIQKSARDGDWKASAWILERRHGYGRGNILQKQHLESETAQNIDELSIKKVLQNQLLTSMKASTEALESGSYQAFAALQRQTVSIAVQIKNLDIQGASDSFDISSDEELIEQISQMILTLPPVLQQRLSQDIVAVANHKISSTITEA